ncbi:FAD:protein FMN transferase [Ideonella livida]|uniref:FAD:protein FMN transferase n=1 Tax=Ideonella livida TaxID=2707176 RepID=A0A7C9TLY0_9BURK|nr:FAD:protein FMN transferase [Ideonella livida]NDY93498.1 FAD:protein FMN transferase [Ideonella livida]
MPHPPAPELQREFRAMGSPCRVRVAGAAATRPATAAAVQAAVDEVLRLERAWSRYRPESIVSRLNATAGGPEPLPLDAETAAVLGFADQLWHGSGGLFDVTAGVLNRAWDFRATRLPTPEAITALLPLVGWGQVEWACHGGQALRLPRAGMALDLGGLGKEYAADRAATLLMDAGCDSGYVNLGGDLRLLGPMPDGRPWHLGIVHPRQPGAVAAAVDLAHGGLATSGDYERFLEVDGRRYCHILNPLTGWPTAHWQSVSVIAPACLAAGALSTVAMLLGPHAPDFLAGQGVSALLIDPTGQLLRVAPAPATPPPP